MVQLNRTGALALWLTLFSVLVRDAPVSPDPMRRNWPCCSLGRVRAQPCNDQSGLASDVIQ
ncbi:MAG TPA: hypothetical protein VGK29_03190 [Paludibaculum sp.]|jgi:hypothetical protein